MRKNIITIILAAILTASCAAPQQANFSIGGGHRAIQAEIDKERKDAYFTVMRAWHAIVGLFGFSW